MGDVLHQDFPKPAQLFNQADFDTRQMGALTGIYRPNRLHANWKPLPVVIDNDIHQTAFDVPRASPRAVVAFITGCEASPLLSARKLQKMYQAGIHVVAIPLLNRRQDEDFIAKNDRLVEWFLFDEASPLHDDALAGLDKFAVTHSAAGMYTTKAQMKEGNAQKACAAFKGFIHTAPYYDSNASSLLRAAQNAGYVTRALNNSLSGIYGIYADRFAPNSELGGTNIDKAWLKLIGSKKTNNSLSAKHFPNPRHGDAIQLRLRGRAIIKELEALKNTNPHHPIFNIHQTYVLPSHDPASCARTSRYVAALKGAKVKHSDAEHTPLVEDSLILPWIINEILKDTRARQPAQSPAGLMAIAAE